MVGPFKQLFAVMALAVVLVSVAAPAAQLSQEQKKAELEALSSLIKNQYGPYDYKERQLKISVDALVSNYVEQAKDTSNLQFYYLLNRFIAEFRDSHFGSRLQTDHVSQLGFITDRVEGKALIEEIDRALLPEKDFPYKRGDEIVSLNGVEATQIVDELSKHLGMGYKPSALRLATQLLGYRSAAVVPPQTGKASVVIRSLDGVISTVELNWKQTGDSVETVDAAPVNKPVDFLDLSLQDVFANFPKTEKGFRCSGKSRFAIPEGATVIVKEPFIAYYHATAKGNVGYLRIPHYSWRNTATNADENALRWQQYEYAVNLLEQNTVGLIIDQDHNCGGNVDHLEQMVSLFANKPFKGLEFQFLASRNEYLTLKTWLTTEERSTVQGEDYLKVLELVRASWMKGERLTAKTTFRNNRLVQPNTIRYTKPILILIDELSGSGGDAFPAMMQGYGFAKLLGTRTMGAGGHVVTYQPMNYSANTLRMTKSLFFHPDGTAIENNGATPDINYTITKDDFVNGYKAYQAAYLEALFKMIP